MRRMLVLVAALAAFMLFCPTWAAAIIPNVVSDTELATYPIVVVAQWEKAPKIAHEKRSGNVVYQSEEYTKLKILSVLRGPVEPGEVDLRVHFCIGWDDEGIAVTSNTSTMVLGDVRDITKPCLWFLKRERSWDEERKEEYLSVGNFREIQPLELKEFYLAMSQSDAKTAVPRLLTADKPLVAERVLPYLCGGYYPWPSLHRFDILGEDQQGKPLRGEAKRVWEFIKSDAKEQRSTAVSVYGELAGKDGIENIRTLLDDKDPSVRAMAVGLLARQRDKASVARFAKAVEGFEDDDIDDAVVDELSSWKDPRVVPALIEFLQSDGLGERYDADRPATKARKGLTAITGHVFPFDVELSRKAWQDALKIENAAARRKFLEEVAPGDEQPFVATAVGSPRSEIAEAFKERLRKLDYDEVVITIRIKNVSPRPVTLLKYPTQVLVEASGFSSSRGYPQEDEEDRTGFCCLTPGESMDFETIVPRQLLSHPVAERCMSLSFLKNGKEVGEKAWIGTVKVEFGADWKPE